jgi:hypothetical protein
MIAAGQRQPVILESELPEGKTSRRCESANWLPGRCGLLPQCFTKQEGRWLPRSRAGRDRKSTDRHLSFAMRSLERWLKQSQRRFRGDSGRAQEPRQMRSGVAGPGPHSSF